MATNVHANGQYLGYWMMSAITEDLAAVTRACQQAGATILRTALAIERPFMGIVNAMLVRAPGGEWLEILQSKR